MTVYVLADRQPVRGQAVLYRLRPSDELQAATWNGRDWVVDTTTVQTARAHHQWTPAPAQESAPPPQEGDPARQLLATCLQLHPELLEVWP